MGGRQACTIHTWACSSSVTRWCRNVSPHLSAQVVGGTAWKLPHLPRHQTLSKRGRLHFLTFCHTCNAYFQEVQKYFKKFKLYKGPDFKKDVATELQWCFHMWCCDPLINKAWRLETIFATFHDHFSDFVLFLRMAGEGVRVFALAGFLPCLPNYTLATMQREKEKVVMMIRKLGGRLIESDEWDQSITHVVTSAGNSVFLARSPRFTVFFGSQSA